MPRPQTITEFLEARIAEDEAVARDRPSSAHIHESGCYYYDYSLDANWFCDCDEDGAASRHLLAECAAKRSIVDSYSGAYEWARNPDCPDIEAYSCMAIGLGDAIRALASIYASHPDYRQEWSLA